MSLDYKQMSKEFMGNEPTPRKLENLLKKVAKCPKCDFQMKQAYLYLFGNIPEDKKCVECKGQGYVQESSEFGLCDCQCSKCHGSGISPSVPETERKKYVKASR